MGAPPENSELGLQLSTTRLTTAAWHVLDPVIRRRRPARLSDLATIFASTPEFVRLLCSLPDYPLRLGDDLSVTLSPLGVITVAARSDVIRRYLDFPPTVPRLYLDVPLNEIVRTCCRKRKRVRLEVADLSPPEKRNCLTDVGDEMNFSWSTMIAMMGGPLQNVHTQFIRKPPILECDNGEFEKVIEPAMFTEPSFGHVSSDNEDLEHKYDEMGVKYLHEEGFGISHQQRCTPFHSTSPDKHEIGAEVMINSFNLPQLPLPPHVLGNSGGGEIDDLYVANSIDSLEEQMIDSHEGNEAVIQGFQSLTEHVNGNTKEVSLLDPVTSVGHNQNQPTKATFKDISCLDKPGEVLCKANNEAFLEPITEDRLECQGELQIPPSRPVHKDGMCDMGKSIPLSRETCKSPPYKGPEQLKLYKNLSDKKQYMKLNYMNNGKREPFLEKREKASSVSNNRNDKKPFPEFESFVVEEEEGSGGYGTVYRARRKADGVTFAIKCPHVNANRNCVINEMKMLERLRGKNFVIRYEGSLKSGSADCLVLEHVEHDRPENLRREIDIIQLQWYGYCLFKALAGLHKQGIVHRDVKPGNFLYSRKVNKGYLIDFNLALVNNTKAGHNSNDHIPIPQNSSLNTARSKKLMNTKFPEAVTKNSGKKVSTSLLPPGNLKKKVDKAKVFTEASSRRIIRSQGGDGSGITSTKDGTSNKTRSGERLREPMPNTGRSELLSLVQEALKGGNYESASAPKSKRKRVSASPGDTENSSLYITPMPLHNNGVAVRGAGQLKTKGEGKSRREGPCAGTKGFKAPEVLFRSLHQGPKVDIWSAGVTLLYLMIGRAPFTGDADQNIKEIAKLRGSEDLWELARLHDRESSFPRDLFDAKYLTSTKLGDWCARNTRRPGFLQAIPRSLFDLVDKCLIVNPRHRISADEALSHEFFSPCRHHNEIKKEKAVKARDIP
ncbi:Protein kinase superfamily protein [Striga hermonthica]|uniref:non-specific serine/threonine protein kinase n=1 Tax=Striga hermonthica TaxID=68872 RepID=A0A9N7RNP2_STRHE|nr:Protein kinase superfamily protein [Striga hermonthica]